MKYYRHTMTMREELTLKRRQARVQAGYDFLIAMFLCFSTLFIGIVVLS
jgi:hypothetical protein